MSLPHARFSTQTRANALSNSKPIESSSKPTDENILVAAASQFSKLVQVHKLSAEIQTAEIQAPESQTKISSDDLARVDAVKQEAIAKIIMLLMAYYKTQGWNPQDIKTLALNILEQG